ncbi:MAG TPA: hypothetical protein VMK66_00720 [Myxococcales bacterium]|nr:hypothetical protein [Myxococcales bacterium]
MARKNPTLPAKSEGASASEAREDLAARALKNADGATLCRSDPLADAQAARAVVRAVEEHSAELSRRGLDGGYCEAALQLAKEIEDHLQALPAAALSARGRSQELAELLADAAATAQAVRSSVLRVARGAEGRRVAHDFGFGDPFSARQPAHVARALTRILAALETHREVRADIGLLPEDVQAMQDLVRELGALAGAPATVADEQAKLQEAQGALRAFFDLFAAKASLALAADPDERSRLLSLLPRAEERRHLRREPTRASG